MPAQDAANRIVQTAHHQLGVQLSVSQPLTCDGIDRVELLSQASFHRTSGVVDILTRIRAAAQRTPEPTETCKKSCKQFHCQNSPSC